MTVSRCSECGTRQTTRSRFETDCVECGGELVEEDAYDPEPEQLRCSGCAYIVDAGGSSGDRDDFDYAAGLTVDDPCPRCDKVLLVPFEAGTASSRRGVDVRAEPERTLARRVAERLLKDHWDGKLPVDVKAIAEAVGLRVVEGDFNHQGLLIGEVIEIPLAEADVAKRFAISHEIGHHELRHTVNEARIEPEANAFASELLVPRGKLRAMVAAGTGLVELGRLFQVSRQAITYALDDACLLNKVDS